MARIGWMVMARRRIEPSVMVSLLLHAYATKQRSSRMIERHCLQDVGYRVVTGNVVHDHATIARFVVRHERALAEVFGQALGLCDRAGLVSAARGWRGLPVRIATVTLYSFHALRSTPGAGTGLPLPVEGR